jgi:hypothetical protein
VRVALSRHVSVEHARNARCVSICGNATGLPNLITGLPTILSEMKSRGNDMAKKRKAKKIKIKRKRTAKKSKAKTPKKPPTSNVDAQTPVGPSVASDEALEDAATASKFTRLCA